MNMGTTDLLLPDGSAIKDIVLAPTNGRDVPSVLLGTNLRFLSLVNPALIPLRLVSGASLLVTTSTEETERWFSDKLLSVSADIPDGGAWWHTSVQSPIGVLAAVSHHDTDAAGKIDPSKPRITEIVFYASASVITPMPPGSDVFGSEASHPIFELHALPLSSDLLSSPPTPPLSPSVTNLPGDEPIASTKRKTGIDDVFNIEVERRRKAQRHRSDSLSTATASSNRQPSSLSKTLLPEHVPSTLGAHRRVPSRSNSAGPDILNITSHRQSRDGSILGGSRQSSRKPDSRPPSRKGIDTSVHTNTDERTSGSMTPALEIQLDSGRDSSIESKNKDSISRLIMAGMRIYGLKKPNTKARSSDVSPHTHEANHDDKITPSSAGDVGPSQRETQVIKQKAKEDAEYEEYKMVYHQTLKATVFTFRHHISTESFHLQTDRIRDTVDRLLAIFCSDPLNS